jgi:adenylate cyclase
MHEDRPSLALAAYELATGDRTHSETTARLIDFYGPGRTIPTVSLYRALAPADFLAPAFFRNKIVFVGDQLRAGKDNYQTAARTLSNPRTPGVEIHATMTANLLDNRTITRLGTMEEIAALLALSLIAVSIFIVLRPITAAITLGVFEVFVWSAAHEAFTYGHLWLPLIIPSVVMLPTAYVMSLVWYYFTTVRERERIRRAFAHYLSPAMIEKIEADARVLNLGGEEILATAMFTDVKGFTSISESMTPHDAAALSTTTDDRLPRPDEGGTLIKFIGDGISHLGAPVRLADHATLHARLRSEWRAAVPVDSNSDSLITA